MKVAALLCNEIDQNSIVFGSKQERDKREEMGEREREIARVPHPPSSDIKKTGEKKKKKKQKQKIPGRN